MVAPAPAAAGAAAGAAGGASRGAQRRQGGPRRAGVHFVRQQGRRRQLGLDGRVHIWGVMCGLLVHRAAAGGPGCRLVVGLSSAPGRGGRPLPRGLQHAAGAAGAAGWGMRMHTSGLAGLGSGSQRGAGLAAMRAGGAQRAGGWRLVSAAAAPTRVLQQRLLQVHDCGVVDVHLRCNQLMSDGTAWGREPVRLRRTSGHQAAAAHTGS